MTYDMLEPCRKDTQFKNLPLLTFCWLTEKLRHWFHKINGHEMTAFSYSVPHTHTKLTTGSNGGMMVEALASHNVACVWISVSMPRVVWVCCGFYPFELAPRGYSLDTPVFPSPQKRTLPNFSLTRNQVDKESYHHQSSSSSMSLSFSLIIIIIIIIIIRIIISTEQDNNLIIGRKQILVTIILK